MKKEQIDAGIKVTTQFNLKQMSEHFERLEKCGMPERKDRLQALPDVPDGQGRRGSARESKSKVAFYADKDYSEDQEVLGMMNEVMAGNLGLRWYNANTEKIKGKPSNPERGLTYQDLDIGTLRLYRYP